MAVVGVVILATVSSSTAQAGIQIVSPYPAVSVSAGRAVTFNFQIRTPTRQRADLQILEAPPGWQTTLRGGGFVIRSIFGAPDLEDAPEGQLEVRVPADAAKAQYQVVLRAQAPSGTNTLSFGIEIAEVAEGAVTLSTDFASLKGTPEAALRYSLTLTNNTPESITFNLAAAGAEGWNIAVRPTGQTQASTVSVDGGQQSNLEVEATPPATATAGTHDIMVTASGGGQTAELTLQAEITGNVQLVLTTPSERLNTTAVAGRRTDFTIEVRNEGSSPVANVTLSATPPSEWRVTFTPETIENIEAQGSQRAVAHITPTGDAVAGDYVLTLNASAEGSSGDAEIRVTVETSRIWGAVGLLVIAAAVIILLRVFRQYGRR